MGFGTRMLFRKEKERKTTYTVYVVDGGSMSEQMTSSLLQTFTAIENRPLPRCWIAGVYDESWFTFTIEEGMGLKAIDWEQGQWLWKHLEVEIQGTPVNTGPHWRWWYPSWEPRATMMLYMRKSIEAETERRREEKHWKQNRQSCWQRIVLSSFLHAASHVVCLVYTALTILSLAQTSVHLDALQESFLVG
jgi:hypothetical protein